MYYHLSDLLIRANQSRALLKIKPPSGGFYFPVEIGFVAQRFEMQSAPN